ncbi:MAG: DNA-protecting protein DprA [Aeromicrobium sp.]|nr:DNA-protecting protein DprA [Burkholderiales bacterium]
MPLPDHGLDPTGWINLDLIPALGGDGALALLKAFSSPSNVFAQEEVSLARVVGHKRAQAIRAGSDPERLDATCKWLGGNNNHLLTLADADYPPALLQIANPPIVLYLKGRRELLQSSAIAVVGSRNATPAGIQNAENFSHTLSDGGLTIVSGLALGIDAAAHRGGLAGKSSTIAVVGTGLDLVYPARNKALAHQISEQGLIISEFSLGMPALAANFPRRNRIISGLARGVLVVEAALASGSLITARQAGEQGREVFAIPGSIHSPMSKGSHQLIKQGAKLVDDANDIFDELNFRPNQVMSLTAACNDPEIENPVLNALGYDAVSIDELCIRTCLPPSQLVGQLTELELAGQVAQLAGGRYQRLA